MTAFSLSERFLSARGASYFTRSENFETCYDVNDSDSCHSESEAFQSWGESIDELLRIRLLQNDWDGEGCAAPEISVVDGAIRFAIDMDALDFPPPQRTHLGVNGTIYFEWHSPEGYREIEVYGPRRAESRFVRKGSDSAEVFEILLQS